MLGIADERAFALFYSQGCYADEIVEGDGHNDKRGEDGIPLTALCLIVVGGAQGEHSEEEADYERAGVAGKDFRGREVENQKAQQRSYKDNSQAAYEDLTVYSGCGE